MKLCIHAIRSLGEIRGTNELNLLLFFPEFSILAIFQQIESRIFNIFLPSQTIGSLLYYKRNWLHSSFLQVHFLCNHAFHIIPTFYFHCLSHINFHTLRVLTGRREAQFFQPFGNWAENCQVLNYLAVHGKSLRRKQRLHWKKIRNTFYESINSRCIT